MIEIITCEKKIHINPAYLSGDFNKYLINETKNIIEKENCNKDIGYILSFKDIKKIKDNLISPVNSNIIFVIDVLIETLKPEINDIYEGKVCMVYSLGVFLNIKDKMKVLIPVKTLSEYTYVENEKKYFKKSSEIKEGDTIKVKITGVKYNKKNFHCFGELA